MTLSIITLSYNTLDLVLECVSSLKKEFEIELQKGEVEVIVVDNASAKDVTDGVEKGLQGLLGVHFIRSSENLGFGKGNNLAVEKAKGEYVLFLNSDTKTLNKGFLEMTEFLKSNSKVGILGGKLLNSDGTPQLSVGKFYNLFNVIVTLFGGGRLGFGMSSPEKISEVDWVSGACMMVKRDLFNKIGGFDKNIFMYMEDMEICYRAKKNGYKTFFYPDVCVKHKEQGSSNRSFAVINIYKGILYFYKKHKSKPEYYIIRFALWLKAILIYILGRLINNEYYIKTYKEVLTIF